MESGQTPSSALAGRARQLALVCVDATAATMALQVAFWCHFDGTLPLPYAAAFPAALCWLVAIRVASNCALRLHAWSFRKPCLQDALRVGAAALGGTIAFSLVCSSVLALQLPWTVYALEIFVASAAFLAVRFSPGIGVRCIVARGDGRAWPGATRRGRGGRRD